MRKKGHKKCKILEIKQILTFFTKTGQVKKEKTGRFNRALIVVIFNLIWGIKNMRLCSQYQMRRVEFMSVKKDSEIKSIVVTAFFAAVIFLGIQLFRVPMPAAVGTPFVHFGHIFVVLAILLLGIKRSMAAGVIGFLLFDIVNGYVHAIPNVLFSMIAECLIVGYIFGKIQQKKENDYGAAVIAGIIYGILNIIIDFLWSAGLLVIAGSTLQAAVAAEMTAIPSTVLNSVFTVIGTAVLYIPVRSAFRRAVH